MSINVDIHTTSADTADTDVSSALAQPLATSPTAARTQAMALLELQKQLDADMARHTAVLASNGITMQTPLIDAHGFPLADKDLMAIRTAKQRINVLRNDSKAVRDRVAQLLQLAINGDAVAQPATPKVQESKPFAKVNSVAEASPAQTAGLIQGDLIVKFGSVTADEPKGLAALAAPGVVVDGTSIQLLVDRQGQAVNLTLTPRAGWGGRGLLGCHLLPL
ncbi:related to 26S proteasome non-ATPase regulatory subunit 9 [Sporisorium reilianum SRZ2]|uniref:Probable 26S proteasome regulatory subunit p27 n=1 Tax=Sporisorium reilianum (strain SRZ2) TaxID=999809 RepID=E6ZZT0_SPORE|nr:related to 26S proteasome non-ATPase regulatory subunit 9 [Sporisorium reilianum SRZ2]